MASVPNRDSRVPGMARGLGEFHLATRAIPGDPRGRVRVFRQVLDRGRFTVAFEPGSATHQALANDQNRFSPPRSLPPILGLDLPDEEDNESGGYVITRYAYSEGAYCLLQDLLEQGYVLEMNEFLELAWSLAQALAWLHRLDIVHGQWNAPSVIAIPTEQRPHPFLEIPAHRFEVLNTGVCFHGESVPREYVERGYYPPEVFLSSDERPDYRALDAVGDVYCFAAFLKDLMQRACSTEELPSQAGRILEALQREAHRHGWKAAPDRLRAKELEILDHLYTIKVRTESLIQRGLRPREERADAAGLLAATEDLHARATSYLERIFVHGFEPVNVFGPDLQHYTTFDLRVAPQRINSFDDSRVVLHGVELPHELVRVTLDERHEGVHVVSARPDRIEFTVEHGFPSGDYRISINNRRTNGRLEIESPHWQSIDPVEVYQPWEGFGNIRVTVRGARLPTRACYELRPRDVEDRTPLPAIVVMTGDEVVVEPGNDAAASAETLKLTFPCDTPAGTHELCANGLPTGLELKVRPRLPEPVVPLGGLEPASVRNHRGAELRLRGRNFHPHMVVAFAGAGDAEVEPVVESSTEARLLLPPHFPAGRHTLLVNHRPSEVELEVVEPRWLAAHPPAVKLLRRQQQPAVVEITGEDLPPLDEGGGYALTDAGGQRHPEAVLAAEEREPGAVHRLSVSPELARGTHLVRFGDTHTGLSLRVRRQAARATVAAAAALLLVAFGLAALGLERALRPRIEQVAPGVVASLGAPRVMLEGAHLAAVELVDEDGETAARLVPEAVPGEEGRYVLRPAGVPPGRYGLRAVSDLLGARGTTATLEVRLPALALEPAAVHRLRPAVLRLRAEDGFDVGRLQQLELRGPDGASRLLELAEGAAALPAGTFGPGDEGTFAVLLDGVALPAGHDAARLDVVGPEVHAVTPNPALLDRGGAISVQIDGTHLLPGMPLALQPESENEAAADPVPLQPAAAGGYTAEVPPGRYALVTEGAGGGLERLAEEPLLVLPAPAIVELEPRRVEPNRPVRFTVRGTNLGALERIVLDPVDGGAAPVEVPLQRDPGKIGLQEAALDFEATLASGSYRLQPATDAITVDVYDDCTRALAAFRDGGEPEPLLACLENGRPSRETLRAAADRLFDRGLLAEAAVVLGRLDGVRAAFRRNFATVFGTGEPAEFLDLDHEQRATPWGVAAAAMGWAVEGEGTLEADDGLPWDLEFVRGTQAADPAAAVTVLEAAIAKKADAAAGQPSQPFEPAWQALATARLDAALARLARGELAAARQGLDDEVIGDTGTWGHLTEPERARALVWQAHMDLWVEGDEESARRTLARAAEMTDAPIADTAQAYLAALDGEETESELGGGWLAAFVPVLRFQREIVASPNYNILTEERGGGVYLTAEERAKSERLHAALSRLERTRPADPLAHHSLVYYLRSAQASSWPNQTGGRRAEQHRARLLALDLEPDLAAVRDFYLVLGELGPFDVPQILVMSRDERGEHAGRIREVERGKLPEPFRSRAESLRKRFLGPSVIWKTQ